MPRSPSIPSADVAPWCEERLHRPREDLQLARLFTAGRQRGRIAAEAAIYVELEAIATQFRDLNVARAKFGWWHEELARLDADRAAHPATRLLAAGAESPVASALGDLVTGMELNLLAGPPADLAEAEAWSERGFSRLVTALAAEFGHGMPETSRHALGIGIGLARQLSAPSAQAARDDIAAAARARLPVGGPTLRAAPPPLRVLTALAWRRATRREAEEATKYRERRRVFLAWRAARGRLPRGLRGE